MQKGNPKPRNEQPRRRREYLASAYLAMKEHVVQMGYAQEIDWQDSRSLSHLSEREFLAESAWVILSSGMRERVVARRYPGVSRAFKDWVSAASIVANLLECERQALREFNSPTKIRAISSLCEKVDSSGFNCILKGIEAEGLTYLMTFDYIGPVTSFHLAKNIGLDVVKPDRHLVRMTSAAGYSFPEELCLAITNATGDKLSVVDVVLWRYATLNPHYHALFAGIH